MLKKVNKQMKGSLFELYVVLAIIKLLVLYLLLFYYINAENLNKCTVHVNAKKTFFDHNI